MLRDEIARYTELSGNDGEHTAIGIIGAYLDGYEKGLESQENIKEEWIPVSVIEDIKAEIRDWDYGLNFVACENKETISKILNQVLQIIDKHIGKAESEG